jgi:hypothetical protein
MTQTGTLIERDGQTYLRVGQRAIPIELDEKGRPRPINPQVARIERKAGRVDVTVKVPCLTIVPQGHRPRE